MPVDEHGDEYDEDWVPDSPVLRGETQVPDGPSVVGSPAAGDDTSYFGGLDEMPHRVRAASGLTGDRPDPGYDPEDDDLEVEL